LSIDDLNDVVPQTLYSAIFHKINGEKYENTIIEAIVDPVLTGVSILAWLL
jgi:hypothetical protein